MSMCVYVCIYIYRDIHLIYIYIYMNHIYMYTHMYIHIGPHAEDRQQRGQPAGRGRQHPRHGYYTIL